MQPLPLRAVNHATTYRVTDESSGQAETFSGEQLASCRPRQILPPSFLVAVTRS